MQAEDLVVNKRCEREVVEEVRKIFPDIGIAVFAQAFVVEAVNLGDLSRFVVPTQNGHSLGVSNFESDKEGDRLHGVIPSVDIVPCVRGS